MKPLGIIFGKTCLVIFVDAMVLNVGGNVLDAISFGIRTALANMPIPHVDVTYEEGSTVPEIEVDDDPERCLKLDTSLVPVTISVGQVRRILAGKHNSGWFVHQFHDPGIHKKLIT